ncbi:MAG: IS1096 element passenger TnpR family protein [Methylobacter sp.]
MRGLWQLKWADIRQIYRNAHLLYREKTSRSKGKVMSKKQFIFTPEQIELLKKQQFSDTEPGTLLKDFNSLLAFIGKQGIAVSEKTQLFAMNTLADLNQLLTHPLEIKLKRPAQKSLPPINALYLLLRSSGLGYIASHGKKSKLMLNEEILADWKQLTPTECYFSLLQAFVYRATGEMVGERAGYDSCFRNCLSFFWYKLNKEIAIDPNIRHGLRFTPGLHNLALMELFGFIATKYTADENEIWPLSSIKPTDWGLTIFGYLMQNNFIDLFFEDDAELSAWEAGIKKQLPAWKKSLRQPEHKIIKEGAYIFNVSLGGASCKLGVPAKLSLEYLAFDILSAFNFDNDHLYEFIYKNQYGVEERIAHPYMDDAKFYADERTVGELPLYKGMTLVFHFDFGDNWEFNIQVEAMPSAELNFTELTVIEKRGTPPKQYSDWS